MLMTLYDFSPAVANLLAPYLGEGDVERIAGAKHDHHWAGYRRWGFTGTESADKLHAVIGDFQLSVERGPLTSDRIVARRANPRAVYAPGGDHHLVPRNLNDLDAREVLVDIIGPDLGHFGRSRAMSWFPVSDLERDARASAALRLDGGNTYLRLGDGLVCQSADYTMSLEAAKLTTNRYLAGQLAFEHPAIAVRRAAASNPVLSADQLTALAETGDGVSAYYLTCRSEYDLTCR